MKITLGLVSPAFCYFFMTAHRCSCWSLPKTRMSSVRHITPSSLPRWSILFFFKCLGVFSGIQKGRWLKIVSGQVWWFSWHGTCQNPELAESWWHSWHTLSQLCKIHTEPDLASSLRYHHHPVHHSVGSSTWEITQSLPIRSTIQPEISECAHWLQNSGFYKSQSR